MESFSSACLSLITTLFLELQAACLGLGVSHVLSDQQELLHLSELLLLHPEDEVALYYIIAPLTSVTFTPFILGLK